MTNEKGQNSFCLTQFENRLVLQVTPPFPVVLATCPVVQFEVCCLLIFNICSYNCCIEKKKLLFSLQNVHFLHTTHNEMCIFFCQITFMFNWLAAKMNML